MADFRRWILAFAALVLVLGSAVPAGAQVNHGIVCNASASVTPNLRHEGYTELVGDILLTCTGATGATPIPSGSPIPQADIQVTVTGAPVTSRILSGTVTEALLVVDDPQPGNQTACSNPLNPAVVCQDFGDGGLTFNQTETPPKYNVFQGTQPGGPSSSIISFLGVPVDPPVSGTRSYRITNIRINATVAAAGAGGFTPVLAFVSSSSSTSVTIQNPQNYVGFVANGLSATTASTSPAFFQCLTYGTTTVGSVTFTEDFATAFKIQGGSSQNSPGTIYYSESGLELEVNGYTDIGTASASTQLQTTITNIPAGVTIYVDNWAQSPASVGCTSPGVSNAGCTLISDATLVTSGSPPADPGTNTITAVTDGTASSVTVVWWIPNTNPVAIDSLKFNIYASFTGVPPSSPPAGLVTAAVSGFSPQLASYSTTGPIPEFSSTVNVATTPTTLFTVSLCQTILLFPYVTDFTGFDTGIAISNTSLDTGSGIPVGANAQPGTCNVTFYGGGAIASTLGTNGVYTSPAVIAPGETWGFSMSSIDPGYGSTPTYGTTGYAIALCNFQYAHGASYVSDTGIRNFLATYLALIIPDAPRAAQPFICSADGGSCSAQTGEQLVH